MKTLSFWFFSFALVAVICFVRSEQKLVPIGKIVQNGREISRCTKEAVRVLFTTPNDVLIVTSDKFHLRDTLQEILMESFAARATKILTNFWTNETDQSGLRTKYSSFLVIVDHVDLHNLFENSSAERWAEYIIVTEATTSWLSEFVEHLRNLGFIKVAIVRVTSNGSISVLCMLENPSSSELPPTLQASSICNEKSGANQTEMQNRSMTTFNEFSWWLRSEKKSELRYARILEGTEKSDDFTKSVNGSSTSFGGEVINIFAEKYGFKLVKIRWENQEVSSWEDAMIRCLNGEVDIFYTVLPPSMEAYGGFVEPISWYKFEALVFVYHPEKDLVSLKSLLTPFSNKLWLCTIVLFGIFALFAFFVDTLWFRGMIRNRITVIDVWAICMWQPIAFVPAKFGLRFVLGMWILHSMNNALLYTGRFSSTLTTSSHNYIKNFQDILDSEKRICGGKKAKMFLKDSNYTLLLKIFDSFEEIPSIDVLNKVIDEDYIGTVHVSYIDRHNWINRANESRLLRIVDEAVSTYPATYLAKKHQPYSKDFNRIIMIAHETGLVKKAQEKYKMKLHQSREEIELASADEQIFKITHFKVAFEILGIGYLISGLVFLTEIYRHKRSAKKLANRKSKREEPSCLRSSGQPDSYPISGMPCGGTTPERTDE